MTFRKIDDAILFFHFLAIDDVLFGRADEHLQFLSLVFDKMFYSVCIWFCDKETRMDTGFGMRVDWFDFFDRSIISKIKGCLIRLASMCNVIGDG